MKKVIVLSMALLVITVVTPVKAQEPAEVSTPSATLQVDYLSRYLLYGFDMLPDDDQAIQPSLTVDLWDSGFTFRALGSWALESDKEDTEEMDYTLAYTTSMMQDDAMQMDVTLNYTYYNFFESSSKTRDFQEVGAKFALPNIIGGGLTPYYRVVRLMPRRGGENGVVNYDLRGWLHIIGMDYMWMAGCAASGEQMPVHLGAHIVYNDGFGYETVDNDWSHAVFEVATPFENIMGGTLTPSVAYQITMDDSVNEDSDEFVVGMNYTYKF